MSQKVARSWIVALLAAGLGLWFAFARSTTREPVPVALTPNDAGTATPAQVAEPAGHGLGQPAAGTHVIAARQQAPELGLAGVVVDDLGAPLARVMVSLHQVGSVVRGADLCNADHYGRFAFPKACGTVRVSIENDLVAPHEVTIADGERRFVELRATEPCIQLEGTVWSGPNPVRDRLVTVRAAEDPLRLVAAEGTNDDGYYSQALRPGRYVLEVGGIALQGASVAPPYALGILELTAARRRVRRDIVLPLAEIRVTVHHAADHAPARGVRVRAVATTQTLERCVTSDQDGKAVFAELPDATSPIAERYREVYGELLDGISGREPGNGNAVVSTGGVTRFRQIGPFGAVDTVNPVPSFSTAVNYGVSNVGSYVWLFHDFNGADLATTPLPAFPGLTWGATAFTYQDNTPPLVSAVSPGVAMSAKFESVNAGVRGIALLGGPIYSIQFGGAEFDFPPTTPGTYAGPGDTVQ